MSRSVKGNETRIRLKDWTDGQAAAEGLAAQILHVEGYDSINPSHPLGGPDGLKDMICTKNNIRCIGAAYFPSKRTSFREVLKKFRADFEGVATNAVDGIAFITNQEVTLSQRQQISDSVADKEVDLFHLERITTILNSPRCYGIRLEYLDIEMTREEQLSYFADRDSFFAILPILQKGIEGIQRQLSNPSTSNVLLSDELERIKRLLTPYFEDPDRRSFASILSSSLLFGEQQHPTVDQITRLIEQLRELERLLPPINDKLQRFRGELKQAVGTRNPTQAILMPSLFGEPVDIQSASDELRQYETMLDRVISKQRMLNKLRDNNKQHESEQGK